MALIDDLGVNLANQRIFWSVTPSVFYEVRDLYSLLQDLFDEIGGVALAGSMAYPTPFSAQTPTDYTLKGKWYVDQVFYNYLKGGSIQTADLDGEVFTLTFAAGGYTNAVVGDRYRTVTGGGATGRLLDFDNSLRQWRVRRVSGTFANNTAFTITGGTGAGTTLASGGFATGEEGWANVYTVGTLTHGGTYIAQNGVVLASWYGNSNAPGNHIDVLVKVKVNGALIDSGNLVFYNRVNRDEAFAQNGATVGDTYDWFATNVSSFGRTPVPLTTEPDTDDTLTNAQALNWINGTNGSIAFSTGTFNVDVNVDGTNEVYGGRVDQNNRSNAILWGVIKYFFRKGATTTIGGVEAQQFRFLNASYAVVKKSPIASIAGGKIFYARGWVPINVAAGDASNYQTITNAGVVTDPPVFYTRARTGVPIGAKVIVVRRSAPNFALLNEFTLAAGNNSGNSTLVVSSAIPIDKPQTGFIRVFDNSGNEDRYAYTSWTGSTFTLSGTLSKTYAAGNNCYVPLIDTTAASGTVSVPLRYAADRDLVSFVRLGSGASKITGDVVNYTITNADSSVPVTAIADTINNN